jgi:hypothetical protein
MVYVSVSADTLLAGLRVLAAAGGSRSPNFVGILTYFRAKIKQKEEKARIQK